MTAAPAIMSVVVDDAPGATSGTLRGWTLVLVGLAAFALVVGIGILDASPVGVAADDAMYVILAKSIATGHGFRFLNLPGAPAATHFPPGYPALLALLWRLAPEFPGNLMLFKAVNAACLAVVAVAVARFARRLLDSAALGIALGAITAVSVPLLVLGSMLLSELFFLALLLLALPALEALVRDREAGAPATAWRAVRVGFAIGVLLLVRTHAIVLVPAMVALLGWRGRWREAAIVGGVAIACLLPWQVWSARHGGVLPAPLLGEYDSYTAWWIRGFRALGPAMIPRTLAHTLPEAGGMFAALFSPFRGSPAHAVTLVALAIGAGAGIVALRSRIPVTLLFLAGYLAIVVVWPFPPGRFIWGVWPLLLLLPLAGAHTLWPMVRGSAASARTRALAMCALVGIAWTGWGYAAYELRAARGQWWASIPRANTARIVPAVRWTLANTAPTDLVAAEDDGAVYLYTGRLTLPVRTFTVQQYLTTVTPQQDAEQGLVPLLDAYPVRAVVVGTTITLAEAGWLAAQPAPRISLHDEFAGGAAFTVNRR